MAQWQGWPGDEEGWTRLAAALRLGAVIVFPTDTLYGLGCLATHEAGVARVLALKGRAPGRGCPLITGCAADVWRFVREPHRLARQLAARFWPGPLTLVLRLSDPDGLAAGLIVDGAAAFRVPALAPARALADRAGGPIVATSANPPGASPPADPRAIDRTILDGADLRIDGGRCFGAQPSTIVDLASEAPAIVREGAIGRDVLAPMLARPVGTKLTRPNSVC